jgi:hypothetical protein
MQDQSEEQWTKRITLLNPLTRPKAVLPIVEPSRARITELDPTREARALTTDLQKQSSAINQVESILEVHQQHRETHLRTTRLYKPIQGMQNGLTTSRNTNSELQVPKIPR